MADTYETEIRILGGLPVAIEYSVQGAEPDVGIGSSYVDDWFIVGVGDKREYKPSKAAKAFAWIYKRIEATAGEAQRILDELNEEVAYC